MRGGGGFSASVEIAPVSLASRRLRGSPEGLGEPRALGLEGRDAVFERANFPAADGVEASLHAAFSFFAPVLLLRSRFSFVRAYILVGIRPARGGHLLGDEP